MGEYKGKDHARFLLGEQAKELDSSARNFIPIKVKDELFIAAGRHALERAQSCSVDGALTSIKNLGIYDVEVRIAEDLIEGDGNRQKHRDARLNFIQAVVDSVAQSLTHECGCKELVEESHA